MFRLLFSLVLFTSLSLSGCSDEGVTEGIINGVPFRFTDKDVKAVPGIPTGIANPYGAMLLPGQIPPQGLTIMVGDSAGSKNFKQLLSIYVFDVEAVLNNPILEAPMAVTAIFEYVVDGERQSIQATAGRVAFNQIGVYNSERVDGEFELIFGGLGQVRGSFFTRVGLAR